MAKTKVERARERRRQGRDPIDKRRRFAKKVKPPPRRGVRVETDVAQVRRMASLGCSQWEMTVVLGISERTFRDRLNNDPAFNAAYQLGQLDQLTALRRLQWRHARGKNGTAMTIHLSKHLLGQHDKSFVMSMTVEELDELISQMEAKHATVIEGPKAGADAGEHSEAAPTAPNGSGKGSK